VTYVHTSYNRLRPNDSALTSQVVANSAGHSLPVPVWSALSTVWCTIMCLKCTVIDDVRGVHSRHTIVH